MSRPSTAQPDQADAAPGGANPLRSWPKRPQRLATAVAEDLVDRIVGGELPVGSALPIEPVLCEMFAVSRTVIREAVKSLEGMRLVTIQQGSGTTINDAEDWDLLDPVVLAASIRHDAERAILEDLIDVRRALEGHMAGQAGSMPRWTTRLGSCARTWTSTTRSWPLPATAWGAR
jgi:DNA-binding GntR family transcriptional regulator